MKKTFACPAAGARALGRRPGNRACRRQLLPPEAAAGQEEVQLGPGQRERGEPGAAHHPVDGLGRDLPDGRLRPRELRCEEPRRRLTRVRIAAERAGRTDSALDAGLGTRAGTTPHCDRVGGWTPRPGRDDRGHAWAHAGGKGKGNRRRRPEGRGRVLGGRAFGRLGGGRTSCAPRSASGVGRLMASRTNGAPVPWPSSAARRSAQRSGSG